MTNDKTLRFYLLAVCFVAVVCAAITAGMALYGLVRIAAPELTLDSWSYSAHQSLENFRLSRFNPENNSPGALYPQGRQGTTAMLLNGNGRPVASAANPDSAPLSDEVLEQLRQQSLQQIIANHRRAALQDLIRLSIVLLISAVLFAIHWRIANTAEHP